MQKRAITDRPHLPKLFIKQIIKDCIYVTQSLICANFLIICQSLNSPLRNKPPARVRQRARNKSRPHPFQ